MQEFNACHVDSISKIEKDEACKIDYRPQDSRLVDFKGAAVADALSSADRKIQWK